MDSKIKNGQKQLMDLRRDYSRMVMALINSMTIVNTKADRQVICSRLMELKQQYVSDRDELEHLTSPKPMAVSDTQTNN